VSGKKLATDREIHITVREKTIVPADERELMTNNSSFAGYARHSGLLRQGLMQGLTVSAIQLGLCAAAFGNIIYTSSGFEEARQCASSSSCVRNGRISDARQSGSEVASEVSFDSKVKVTGFSWIGDHFDGDRFVFRLYGDADGRPTHDPLYEFDIGTAFTTTQLVATPGFLSGWQLNASLTPFVLEANRNYFASLSVLGDATSLLTYSWDVGQSSSGPGEFRRDDFTGAEWESAGPRVAAYQFSGKELKVPEPAMLALLVPGVGLVLFGGRRRRRRHKA
jgi:hypothetical protein